MKKITLTLAILFTLITAGTLKAQVSVNVNIGQPAYYYMPDVGAYYHVTERVYYYQDRGRWVHRRHLPGRYRNYNVYNIRRIEVHEPRPYLRHSYYRERYSRPQRARYSYEGRGHRGEHKHHKVHHGRGPGRGHGHGKHR